MRYLSVCSGIDSASVAWPALGFECVGFSEIDESAIAVLAHHYPTVPNLGDMEKFRDWTPAAFDVLVGGTPCQSFSVAGLRKGLDDPRGNLALVYLAIADKFRPRWLVWENVPGAFSSLAHTAPDPSPPSEPVGFDGRELETIDEYDADESHAFACFLAGLQELGYGFAYRTLDARYFGVPQRRRRIFLVASLGGWTGAAAVLFERASLRGDSPPRGAAREDTAGTLGARTAGGGRTDDLDGHGAYVPELADPITSSEGKTYTHEGTHNFRLHNVVAPTLKGGTPSRLSGGDDRAPLVAATLSAGAAPNSNVPGRRQEDDDNLVAETLTTRPYADTPSHEAKLVVASFDETQITHRENRSNADPSTASLATTARPPAIAIRSDAVRDGESLRPSLDAECVSRLRDTGFNVLTEESPTLDASRPHFVLNPAEAPVAFKPSHYTRDKDCGPSETHPPLMADADKGDQDPVAFDGMAVRRLTPRECERLQGLPDDYTLVLLNGKPLSDTARYRLVGNSIARPCLEWIGARLVLVDELLRNSRPVHTQHTPQPKKRRRTR